MTDQLRDPLHDLLAEVPAYVVPDARAAWAAGSRRRSRRRLAVIACALVLLALGAVVAVLPRSGPVSQAGTHGDPVSGHPSRIEHAWWARDLPDRPGAIAGVVERVAHRGSYDEDLGWYAVSPSGHLWHVPGSGGDLVPAVSPDGTRLAWLGGRSGQGLVVADLVTGEYHPSEVGVPEGGHRARWLLAVQAPSFWSPDSSRLLVPVHAAADNPRTGVDALVVGDGATTEVRLPRTRGAVMPVGWVSDGSPAWLAWRHARGGIDAVQVLVTDVHGRVQRTVRLDVGHGVGGLSQWAGVVSPDGRTLALGATGQQHRAAIRFYDLASGRLRATTPGVPDAAGVCLPTWGGGTLQVPTEGSDHDAVLRSVNGSSTILADPRLGIECSLWATAALDERAHAGLGARLFGDSTSWLSWHWRESGAGVLVVVLSAAGIVLVVRRRRVSG